MENKIFKYFGQKEHQDSFLGEGEVYFKSLSYFINCEDPSRKDVTEGANQYRPYAGLKVFTRDTEVTLGSGISFNSAIKRPDRFFIFCASRNFSESLIKKFGAYSCIEISNLEDFQKRLKRALIRKCRKGSLRNSRLLADPVNYYEKENSPGSRYACPDEIIMSKPNSFEIEQEYRFAFAKKRHAFDVDKNLKFSLSKELKPYSEADDDIVLKLGDLTDICSIVSRY